MSYTQSHYVCVNGKKFYAFTSASDRSLTNHAYQKLAYTVGNATYYVPLQPAQASGVNVCIGGSVYHAVNLKACLQLYTCTVLTCPTACPICCIDAYICGSLFVGNYLNAVSVPTTIDYCYSTYASARISNNAKSLIIPAGSISGNTGVCHTSGLNTANCRCIWIKAKACVGSFLVFSEFDVPRNTCYKKACAWSCTVGIYCW